MAETPLRFENDAQASAWPDRSLPRLLWQALDRVLRSAIGGKVRWMFGAIVALLLAINGLNVLNSYIARDLVTAIERRSFSSFFSLVVLWVGVFTGLTLAAVVVRFVEERLALLWRAWLTRTLVEGYLEGGAYLRLKERGDVDNPDQRISDDARAFTATTLSFVLMGMNAVFGIAAFSGVLWSISPTLFVVAVGYALLGSLVTVVVGRPLVRLNYDQADCEASFRAELVHAGENAESVALLKLESRVRTRLGQRLDGLVANMKHIVAVNRRVGVFTVGYNYGIQLLPPLIVGPLFMRGKVEFGVVTQSAMAFAQLLGAFSLIVTQFGSISSYAATLVRLGTFSEALERSRTTPEASAPSDSTPPRLVYDDLSLDSHDGAERLVAHLSVSVEAGQRLLVTGTAEARRALFRATALGHQVPSGRVVRPGAHSILFLPERPYVPPATLRELLGQSVPERAVTDDVLTAALRSLELESVLARVGGLDVQSDFSHALSLGEQQLLAIARVLVARPVFVVLHNPGSTLAPEQLELALERLTQASITYVTLGGIDSPLGFYDSVLEIHAGGAWGFRRDSQLPSRPISQPMQPC